MGILFEFVWFKLSEAENVHNIVIFKRNKSFLVGKIYSCLISVTLLHNKFIIFSFNQSAFNVTKWS